MELELLLKGLVLGFAIAAPVGPIGLLCIRRSLVLGPRHGFATGLGAAAADSFYGAVAGFGMASVSNALLAQQYWVRLLGGLFLAFLGLKVFFAKPNTSNVEDRATSLFGSFASAFFLTVTNPMTIISFAGAFAGLGFVAVGKNYLAGALLVTGVFVGSAIWWFILSGVSGMLRHRVSERALMWINRASGVLILIFAALALLSVLRGENS